MFCIWQSTGNKNLSVKITLARSLDKVTQMLLDMEGRIEKERKVLSRIDRELVHQGGEVHLDKDLDYHNVDIFWEIDNSTTRPKGSTLEFGNIMSKMPTTSTIIPKPTRRSTVYTTAATIKMLEPGDDKRKIVFLIDINHDMTTDHHGYFTAFLTRFTDLVYRKNTTYGYSMIYHLVENMRQQINEGKFFAMDNFLINGIKTILSWFDLMTPDLIKEQALVFHFMLKAKYDTHVFRTEYNDFMDYYDEMFSEEEGQALFEALFPFFLYPDEEVSFMDMVKNIFDAGFAPYFRETGKRKQRKLIQLLINVMDAFEVNPQFRAQQMSSVEISDTHANLSTTDENESTFPERRSMNYRRIVKHLQVKHPKLFKKIKLHFKHGKKSKHHHLSHKRKSHHNYRKSRSGHQRHKQLHEHEHVKRRARAGRGNEPENGEDERDSIENSAYQLDKIRHTQTRHGELKQRKSKQRQWKRLSETRSTTEPRQDNVQYLKQLAISYLRKKQQEKKTDKASSQNFYRNRRLNIPSSEEETCNHSEYFQDSMGNVKLCKIREASSYSDEEYQLLNSGDDINNKQTLRSLSSETDDE